MLGIPPEEFADRLVQDRHLNMLTIKGIYGREMYETWYAMSVLLEGGLDLSPVITAPLRPPATTRRRFADGGRRPRRQGHPRLDRDLDLRTPRSSSCSTPCATTSAPPSTRSAPPGCYKPERVIGTPQSATVASPRAAPGEVLNFCANNYLGLADHPARRRGRPGGAGPLGLRHGLRALHLRHAGDPQGARGAAVARSSAGGHDPLRLLLRRQRRALRDAARPRGRGHLRRAQPRLDHRRHPAVQGPAPPLRQPRHGRAGGAAQGGRRARAAG